VRDIYEVLREKEDAIERVRREVEALRSVSFLLDDETARSNIAAPPAAHREVRTETAMVSQQRDALSTAVPLFADETDDVLAKIRARLIEAAENDSKLGRSKKISRRLRHIAAPLLGASLR
jgi:hypothetical protein